VNDDYPEIEEAERAAALQTMTTVTRETLAAALPAALEAADDAGSVADDWVGSEYVDRLADAILAALRSGEGEPAEEDLATLLVEWRDAALNPDAPSSSAGLDGLFANVREVRRDPSGTWIAVEEPEFGRGIHNAKVAVRDTPVAALEALRAALSESE
jgi:hypothetical protein